MYGYVNIRGIEYQECTAETWQSYAWHISSYTSSTNGCQFDGINSVPSEQNFGRYMYVNSAFRCTANLNSTTQHWIGIVRSVKGKIVTNRVKASNLAHIFLRPYETN